MAKFLFFFNSNCIHITTQDKTINNYRLLQISVKTDHTLEFISITSLTLTDELLIIHDSLIKLFVIG